MIGLDLLYRFAAGECGGSNTVVDSSCLPHSPATANVIDKALQIVFGLSASIALLVIVIAGFRYIVAHGDPNAMAQARNALLYAIIGLIITLAAFTIVTFVIGSVG